MNRTCQLLFNEDNWRIDWRTIAVARQQIQIDNRTNWWTRVKTALDQICVRFNSIFKSFSFTFVRGGGEFNRISMYFHAFANNISIAIAIVNNVCENNATGFVVVVRGSLVGDVVFAVIVIVILVVIIVRCLAVVQSTKIESVFFYWRAAITSNRKKWNVDR